MGRCWAEREEVGREVEEGEDGPRQGKEKQAYAGLRESWAGARAEAHVGKGIEGERASQGSWPWAE